MNKHKINTKRLSDTHSQQFENTMPLIKSMLLRSGFAKACADDDFYQNVLLLTLMRTCKFDPKKGSAFATFIANSARYASLDSHKIKKNTVIFNDLNDENPALSREHTWEIDEEDEKNFIRKAIEKLSTIQQHIIILRFFAEKSMKEIYGFFNLSKNSVDEEYKQALDTLRIELASLNQ